jgi:hypothetical protein
VTAMDPFTGKLAGEGPGVTAMDPFTGKLAVVIGGGSGMGRGAGGRRAG